MFSPPAGTKLAWARRGQCPGTDRPDEGLDPGLREWLVFCEFAVHHGPPPRIRPVDLRENRRSGRPPGGYEPPNAAFLWIGLMPFSAMEAADKASIAASSHSVSITSARSGPRWSANFQRYSRCSLATVAGRA